MAGGGPMDKPWILVFDMDETLTDKYGRFNMHVVNVLIEAVKQKSNAVKYIFLLTNNPSFTIISDLIMSMKLTYPELERKKIFDAIKYLHRDYRQNPKELMLAPKDIQNIPTTQFRYYDGEVQKEIRDVIDLLIMSEQDDIMGVPITPENIFSYFKIMFFDDKTHLLSSQLDKGDTSQYRYVQVLQDMSQKFKEELTLLGDASRSIGSSASKTRKRRQKGGSRKNKKFCKIDGRRWTYG